MAYSILFNTLENEVARRTCEELRAEGHKVYMAATQEALEEVMSTIGDSLDMVVLSIADSTQTDHHTIRTGLDMDAILDVASEKAAGILTMAKATIPYLRNGKRKRIALLTDETASIRESREESDYGYHMSQAAADMVMKILFNTYRPEGFTFRCFAESPKGGMSAAEYLLTEQSYIETDDYIHSDENRLVLRDGFLREITW
ncbi:MAG: hypothetical protein K6G30_02490 [Acetatifactor sp.]|nr:hypothetical protein [Acetatifactor sp.]